VSTTLYLLSTATASPFPTTSHTLSTTNNASEVTLTPGEFDNGLPGTTDAGQWNPSSPLASTTLAAEIDNTGASLGTTRQGWLWDLSTLTGRQLKSGAWSAQLRLNAVQGTGTTGNIMMRATIVTGSSGSWVTAANLLTTAITGEASHTTGQNGWRAHEGAVITVTSTTANFAVTVQSGATSPAHTFASGERLLIELGFGNGNSTTDRTWRLDYNTANSFVTVPDIIDPVSSTMAGAATMSTSLRTRTASTMAGESTMTCGLENAAAASPIASAMDGVATMSANLINATGPSPIASAMDGVATMTVTLTAHYAIACAMAGSSTMSADLGEAGAAPDEPATVPAIRATQEALIAPIYSFFGGIKLPW
jgi:hypothetical protein